jgi:protein-L-isoaspartate(D-aspartate) O-methyltransferase
VGILQERRINNGQPSLYAGLMAQARIEQGGHLVHIGAGTDILAHLTGPAGRVTAVEYDAGLVVRATANLSGTRVPVFQGDGAAIAFDPTDVIYVNAGVTTIQSGKPHRAVRILAMRARSRRRWSSAARVVHPL